MAYNDQISVGQGFCEAVKLGLAVAGGPNNQSFKSTPGGSGLIQALLDPANIIPDFQTALNGSPTSHQVKVNRLPRNTESDVREGHLCVPGEPRDITEQLIDSSTFYKSDVAFQITESQLVGYCEDLNRITTMAGSDAAEVLSTMGESVMFDPNFSHFSQVFNLVASQLNGLRNKMNRDIAAKLISSLGINVATGLNTPFSIPLLNLSDSSKREEAIQIIGDHLLLNQVSGGYLLVGIGNLHHFVTSYNYGCCNASGLDWDAMATNSPFKYYRDICVGQEYGDRDFFLLLPLGETQFVHRSYVLRNESRGLIGKGIARGYIYDPLLPGVKYDIEVQHESCRNGSFEDVYNVYILSTYDVVITPEFAYDANDPMFGYNGILGYIGTKV